MALHNLEAVLLVIVGGSTLLEHAVPAELNQPAQNTLFNLGYDIFSSWLRFALKPALGIAATLLVNHRLRIARARSPAPAT